MGRPFDHVQKLALPGFHLLFADLVQFFQRRKILLALPVFSSLAPMVLDATRLCCQLFRRPVPETKLSVAPIRS